MLDLAETYQRAADQVASLAASGGSEHAARGLATTREQAMADFKAASGRAANQTATTLEIGKPSVSKGLPMLLGFAVGVVAVLWLAW